MAFDSDGHYYNPVDITCRHLPPEYQTCGRCGFFIRYNPCDPNTEGKCGLARALSDRSVGNLCEARGSDGTPQFEPLSDVTEGWIYPPRKRIPYSTNTEL